MNYERFGQLWDALVTNRPKTTTGTQISNGMSSETAEALIAYAEGRKEKVLAVRAFLDARAA